MDFWDRMKNAMEKGLEGSRELLGKAKDRAQDLGERGVLRLEIMQLENQAEKLVGKLGTRTYEALVTEQRAQLDKQTEGIGELISEIDDVHAKIREKEAALEIAMRRERGEDVSGGTSGESGSAGASGSAGGSSEAGSGPADSPKDAGASGT